MKKGFGILLFIFTIHDISLSQQAYLRFEHISLEQGLSQSEVNCICQDNEGFIWIGTLDGLNKYDGYDIKVYRKNTDIHNSISNNYIESIYQDNQNNLWIGTLGGGLNKYDKFNDEFISYIHDKNNTKSIASNSVNFITQSRNGDLLLGTQQGLTILKYKNSKDGNLEFNNYFDFEINAILEDNSGYIWLASWNGLYKIEINKKGIPIIISHYTHDPSRPTGIISDGIYSIFLDKGSTLWIGTNNGLDMLNLRQFSSSENIVFTHYQYSENCNNCLPNNDILAICQDQTGKLILGTRGGGLSYFNLKNKYFSNYKAEKNIPYSLSNNSVKCFFEDKTRVIWIGTLGGGINKLDLHRKQFNNYEIVLKNGSQVPSNFVRSIYEDKDKLLWIGTLDGGLFTFDRKNNTFVKFKDIENVLAPEPLIHQFMARMFSQLAKLKVTKF